MHYPVNVFVGKIRDYAGSRPSAIDKIQVDGELQLGDLGLDGDQQAEKKIHGGPDRALVIIRANTMPTGSVTSPSRPSGSARRRSAKTSPPPGLPSKTFISAISFAGARR